MTKEELIKRLEESAIAIYEDEGSYDYMFKAIADEVKASDLVEVIRCKDCKYCIYPAPKKWEKHDVKHPPYCDWWIDNGDGFDVEENDFCSHAERKEEKQ